LNESDKEITKFDPDQIMKNVSERIKDTFASLIPDDQWEKMVKKEIDSFFVEIQGDRWQNAQHHKNWSKFQLVVWDELEKFSRHKIKEAIDKCKSYKFDGDKLVLNEIVEKLIIENADKIMLSLIRNAVQHTVNNLNIPGY